MILVRISAVAGGLEFPSNRVREVCQLSPSGLIRDQTPMMAPKTASYFLWARLGPEMLLIQVTHGRLDIAVVDCKFASKQRRIV